MSQCKYEIKSQSLEKGINGTVLTLNMCSPVSMTKTQKAFESLVGKGEGAGNKHFPLFPPSFPTH